ncbi:hypothetical protein JB92DRAFT_3188517 [Gautieria morchelliformis]|nr:hypothetical protein JB92DRAFT_3188517 [Gautieria morchelliformis]
MAGSNSCPPIKYFKENGCVILHKCTTIRHTKPCHRPGVYETAETYLKGPILESISSTAVMTTGSKASGETVSIPRLSRTTYKYMTCPDIVTNRVVMGNGRPFPSLFVEPVWPPLG